MKIRNLLSLILLALALAFAGSVAAQERELPGQQAAPDIQVTDQQLEQFVDAQTAIVEIQQDFSAQLEQVDDPEKAHELQVEANEEMTGAVEDAGLTVESYNQIAMAIQNDPELQERLTRMIQ